MACVFHLSFAEMGCYHEVPKELKPVSRSEGETTEAYRA